jgi:hypothetical protein
MIAGFLAFALHRGVHHTEFGRRAPLRACGMARPAWRFVRTLQQLIMRVDSRAYLTEPARGPREHARGAQVDPVQKQPAPHQRQLDRAAQAMSPKQRGLGPDDKEDEEDAWRPGVYRCPACSIVLLIEIDGEPLRCLRRGCPLHWHRLV